jgi:hypothetical protein
MDHPKPTSTRITAGPLNGDPSSALVLSSAALPAEGLVTRLNITTACPAFKAPTKPSQVPAQFGDNSQTASLDIKFGTNRDASINQTSWRFTPSTSSPASGPVAVDLSAFQSGNHDTLQNVRASARVEGRDVLLITLCVDSQGSSAGKYIGTVFIADPRFTTAAVSATVEVQGKYTTLSAIAALLMAIGAIAVAAVLIAAAADGGFGANFRKQIRPGRIIAAVFVAIPLGMASWYYHVYNIPTYGSNGLGVVGDFWTIGGIALAAATSALGAAGGLARASN